MTSRLPGWAGGSASCRRVRWASSPCRFVWSLPWPMSWRCRSQPGVPVVPERRCMASWLRQPARSVPRSWHGACSCVAVARCAKCAGTPRAALPLIWPAATATRSRCTQPAWAVPDSSGWSCRAGVATMSFWAVARVTRPPSPPCAAVSCCAPYRPPLWDKIDRLSAAVELSARNPVYLPCKASDRHAGVRICT